LVDNTESHLLSHTNCFKQCRCTQSNSSSFQWKNHIEVISFVFLFDSNLRFLMQSHVLWVMGIISNNRVITQSHNPCFIVLVPNNKVIKQSHISNWSWYFFKLRWRNTESHPISYGTSFKQPSHDTELFLMSHGTGTCFKQQSHNTESQPMFQCT
jgi:hypothetical protein